MNRKYYAYWYRLENEESFLIWFTDEKDGFVVDESGLIPSFKTIEELKDFAFNRNLVVETNDPKPLNLDIVENWIKSEAETIEDYNPFLQTWNLFGDVSSTTNGQFDVSRKFTDNIYDRIFWGCNISIVTPEGESFTPTWTKKELKITRKTLSFGFQMFRERIRHK